MTELDIQYYDFMIESVVEDRKIMDHIMGAKFSKFYLTESENNHQVAIYEGKVSTSIIEFIRNIFIKIAEFFNKMASALDRCFRIDEKLIKDVEEGLTKDDTMLVSWNKDKSSSIFEITKRINKIEEYISEVEKELEEVMKDFDNFKTRITSDKSPLDELKDKASSYSSIIEELAPELLGKTGSVFESVSFNKIKTEILPQYKEAKSKIRDFKDKVNKKEKQMRAYEKKVKSVNRNGLIERTFFEHLPKYKDVIFACTAFITKASNMQLKLFIAGYKNREDMLREFVKVSKDESHYEI